MRITLTTAMLVLSGILLAQMPAESDLCAMKHHCAGMGARAKWREGIWDRIEIIAEELKLTDKQMEQIQQLRTRAQLDIIDLKAAVEKAQIHLRIALNDPDMTTEQIEQALMALQQAKQSLEIRRFRTLLEIREQLTPAQRKQLAKMFSQFGAKFKDIEPGSKRQKGATRIPHESCPHHQEKGKPKK